MSLEKDVVYHAVGSRELKLDLYRPDGGAVPTRAAVVLVHGGGWAMGDRAMMAPIATQFAAKGFLAVAVEYRLVPEAPWPAQRDDVMAAMRWVADNADRLGIDADRIAILGNSAGAHLAMLAQAGLGGAPRAAAIISLFGVSELGLNPKPGSGLFDAAMLLGPAASDEAIRAASPLHQLTSDFPPVFLLHGGADWLVDPSASVRVYQKLVGLGVPAELHIVTGAHHEFVSEPGMTGPMVSEMALFLDRAVIQPDRWSADARDANIFAQGPEAVQAMIAQMAEQH